jgi:hypothetical protein
VNTSAAVSHRNGFLGMRVSGLRSCISGFAARPRTAPGCVGVWRLPPPDAAPARRNVVGRNPQMNLRSSEQRQRPQAAVKMHFA